MLSELIESLMLTVVTMETLRIALFSSINRSIVHPKRCKQWSHDHCVISNIIGQFLMVGKTKPVEAILKNFRTAAI